MAIESAIFSAYRRKSSLRGLDARIAVLAAAQHGVVSRWQLIEEGLRSSGVQRRLGAGRLHRLYHGVYAVGHSRISREGRWMAAVLAAGPGAVLSHRSAAALWSLRRYNGTPEATVWPRRRSRAGLRLHAAPLPADEVTEHDGIPVTTPARTLLDLASILDPSALERALHEAEVQRLHGPLSLMDLLTRHAGARGTGALRKALNRALIGIDITRSELEHRFLAFLDDQKLPRPRSNAILPLTDRTIEADCVWTPARLIVELDGHATHSTRRGFERDRARDRALQAVGWRVVRITWRQLHDDPSAVARDLRALLGG